MHSLTGQDGREPLERIQAYSYLVSILICSVLVLYFCFLYCKNNATGDSILLSNTININAEPAESIVRLSGLGTAKANAIVEYRSRINQEQPGAAFRCPGDLDNVKGIGLKTIEKIERHIRFE